MMEIFHFRQFYETLVSKEHGQKYQLYSFFTDKLGRKALECKLLPTLDSCVEQLPRLKLAKCWLCLPDVKYILYMDGKRGALTKYPKLIEGNWTSSSGVMEFVTPFDIANNPETLGRIINEAIETGHRAFRQMDANAKKLASYTSDQCAFCSLMPSAKMGKCGKCLKAHYCSESCQRFHWLHHKKFCEPPMPVFELRF